MPTLTCSISSSCRRLPCWIVGRYTQPGSATAASAATTVTARRVSAQDVYRRLIEQEEDIGLATVYRVLTQFEGAGLVTRHHFEGGTAVFELNEGTHHDHIVCVDCGKVEEFTDDQIE